jgi:hypothetical protein
VREAAVRQGDLRDCYLCAAVKALAKLGQIEVVENPDGTYSLLITLLAPNRRDRRELRVTVDADLYARWPGKFYGNTKELLFPIAEKAIAVLSGGSYEALDHGGSPANIFELLLGRPGFATIVTPSDALAQITGPLSEGRPVVLGTRHNATAFDGVDRNHAYAVLGTRTHRGRRELLLFNPLDESEEWMPLDKVVKAYDRFYTVL